MKEFFLKLVNYMFLYTKEDQQPTLLCSLLLIPNFIVYFLIKFSKISQIGICFALGVLLGDLFVHILPDIYQQITHQDDHSSHGHSHAANEDHHHHGPHLEGQYKISLIAFISFYYLMDKFFKEEHSHSHQNTNHKTEPQKIDIKFILFLVKDGLHNLTDGIAISAVYKINKEAGILMAMSLFTEEMFHQIADYGIWINKGWTINQFFVLQILTSLVTVLGSFMVDIIKQEHQVHMNIFVLVSLIYTNFSQIMPELIESKQSVLMLGIEMLALIGGFYIIQLINKLLSFYNAKKQKIKSVVQRTIYSPRPKIKKNLEKKITQSLFVQQKIIKSFINKQKRSLNLKFFKEIRIFLKKCIRKRLQLSNLL